jgi:hypothetical protein
LLARAGDAITSTVSASLAELRVALDTDQLRRWLDATGLDAASRASLERALAHDRALWTAHPASLESCLLARTLGLERIAPLREAWEAEVRASGRPWVRSLRPLPLAEGLRATLASGPGLDLSGLRRIAFADEGTRSYLTGWVANPTRPTILACDAAHVELVAPE